MQVSLISTSLDPPLPLAQEREPHASLMLMFLYKSARCSSISAQLPCVAVLSFCMARALPCLKVTSFCLIDGHSYRCLCPLLPSPLFVKPTEQAWSTCAFCGETLTVSDPHAVFDWVSAVLHLPVPWTEQGLVDLCILWGDPHGE